MLVIQGTKSKKTACVNDKLILPLHHFFEKESVMGN